MRYMEMPLEELEDLDVQLHLEKGEEESSFYRRKIELYSAMYSKVIKLVRLRKEDRSYLDEISKRLVLNLVQYGSYLKMADRKEDQVAIHSLEKALRYEPGNPIAAYRLGFLHYRRHSYSQALIYFEKAINSQRYNDKKTMVLSNQQITNAHLYLTNSALYVAKQAQEDLYKLTNTYTEQLPGYEFSTLFENLKYNENYLNNHGFYRETKEERTTCSKAQCEELADDSPKDTIVLYFGDEETSLSFNRRSQRLTKRESDLLLLLLTNSSADKPASIEKAKKVFNDERNSELQWETYRQACKRLREKLRQIPMPDVIETVSGSQSYYYNGSFPYIILYRVDAEIK